MTISKLKDYAGQVFDLTDDHFGGGDPFTKINFLHQISEVVKRRRLHAQVKFEEGCTLVFWQGSQNRIFSLLKDEQSNNGRKDALAEWRDEVIKKIPHSRIRFQFRIGKPETMLREIETTVKTSVHIDHNKSG